MMLTLDNRKTACTGMAHVFLVKSSKATSNVGIYEQCMCVWWGRERESSINDGFPSNQIYSILYSRWIFPLKSETERQRRRNVQMESIFEVSTTTWFNGHDFSWFRMLFFFCFRSQDHCLEFQMSLLWSSNFTKSFSPLDIITTVLCMSQSCLC